MDCKIEIKLEIDEIREITQKIFCKNYYLCNLKSF